VNRGWLEEQLSAERSIESIAREVDRHPSTVAYWMRKHGLVSSYAERHAARSGLDRDALAELVEQGRTTREIAALVDRSQATVRHWLREYGLRTARALNGSPAQSNADGVAPRSCPRHGTTKFVRRGDDKGWRCLRCRSEAVTRRRQRVKEILVREAGGSCVLCAYDRYIGALGFHHLDPGTKRFSLGDMGVARSLDRARAEARKCMLLCANCHAEVEAGVARVPLALNGARRESISGVAHRVVHDPG
jgi:Homeodomain-like domain-containing protein